MNENRAAPSPSTTDLLRDARPALVRILLYFRIPHEDAEDILQEVSLQYLRKSSEIREPRKWLSGAVRKECLLYRRRKSRALYDAVDMAVLDVLADEATPPQERAVLRARLREVISSLKPRCRRVLELRYHLGYDNREIAEQTGYRPSSVDKIAQRCVAALSRQLVGSRTIGRSQKHG